MLNANLANTNDGVCMCLVHIIYLVWLSVKAAARATQPLFRKIGAMFSQFQIFL